MARSKQHNANSGSLLHHVVPSHIMGPRVALLLSVLALVLIGMVMVFSTSSIEAITEGKSSTSYIATQLAYAAIGIVGGFILWKFIPYHWWTSSFLYIIWFIMVVLLIMTAFLGTEALGAQRWLLLGPVGIQISEFAKIFFAIAAARILFGLRQGEFDARAGLTQVFVLIVMPLFFMYWSQSDLGTTLICFVGILAVMWLGEIPGKVFAALIGFAGVFAVLASTVGYRQDRFIFLNPWADDYGAGYQLIHSFYALAEGGLFGVGLGNSREKFSYLPEAETDFIFAVIGEELGLIGAGFVIVLFVVFLWAGLRITRSAPDNFGAMIAGGMTVMLVFQAFLNIGCVIGLLPTTGKPLPFISSGGSSLIACLCMVGIILSISQASDKPSVYEQRRSDLKVVRSNGRKGSSRGGSYRSESSSSRNGGYRDTPASSRNHTPRTTSSSSRNYRSASSRKGDTSRGASTAQRQGRIVAYPGQRR